jgi:hypothetical protein
VNFVKYDVGKATQVGQRLQHIQEKTCGAIRRRAQSFGELGIELNLISYGALKCLPSFFRNPPSEWSNCHPTGLNTKDIAFGPIALNHSIIEQYLRYLC